MTLSFDPNKTRAILIGASEFEQPDKLLLSLPAVLKNLSDLTQWLQKEMGIPVTQLLNPSTGADITLKLDEIVEEAKKGIINTLIFYYTGHGIPDKKTQALYLATKQTHPDRLDNGGALAFKKVQELLTGLEKVTLIFILDCCYSGKAIKEFSRKGDQSVYFLTATKPNQPNQTDQLADAPEGETYTAFTGELITLLTKGIENHRRMLTLKDIYEHLKTQLTQKGHPEPQCQPWLEKNFVFAYNNRATVKTVFLAEVTDDLESYRNEVKVFLEQQRKQRKDIVILILPTQDYDVSSEEWTKDLKQSDLFLQLLSHLPGKKDLVKTQYDCADTAGIPILQWRSPRLKLSEVQNEAHRQLLKGETVKTMELADFQDEILNQLFPPKSPTASKLTAGALVMVNTTQEDVKLLGEIKRFLKGKQIAYATAAKVSGKILAGQKHLDEKEHILKCTYCFEGPDFPSEKLALKWLLLSHPTTTP